MTSQLFESASLEEALAEVRETVGPHAKIVRAEKVRRGGIGGFFSKETFVLSVESDEEFPGDGFRTVPAPSPVSSWTSAPTTAADLPAFSLDALADLADSDDGAAQRLPAVSTETPLFGQVLQEVSRATALDLELPAGPRWDGRMIDAEATYRSVMPLAPAPAAPTTPPAQAKSREIPLVPFPEESPKQPWWQVLAEVAEQQSAPAQQQPLTIDLEAVPSPPSPPAGPPRLGADAIDDLLTEQAPEPVVSDLAASLNTINAALGPALLPGSVIAVVGHPADAGEVAARVAVAAGADPFAIHFASHDPAAREQSGLPGGRQICSLDEAILRSRRWPSRPTPMVVVVDGRDSRWARTVLDGIETTTVVALPSPIDDETAVRAWVAALGGVQALLVDDSCRTSPESLALHGIPALRSPWSLDRPTSEPGEL